jgi:hypothetical protein
MCTKRNRLPGLSGGAVRLGERTKPIANAANRRERGGAVAHLLSAAR